jgi:spermidine/putrescine transport system ATP-binding protein
LTVEDQITGRAPAPARDGGAGAAQLSLRSVAKRFGDVVALHHVDLDIERGEFFTLLGPSGCGKTTLLRIIGGFERPSEGSVLIDGRDVTGAPPESRPSNMVFQSYALFPHMTVAENVAYGLRTARVRGAEVSRRVASALELVGLEALADRSVRALSGGQQQRVALVRALVNEPEVLLLDEPLGALDLQLRKRMQDELRSIQARLGTTFVYVTHDQEEALALSHRIALMSHGHLVQVGSARDVYEQPRTRFVAEFVGDATLLPGRVEQTRGKDVDVRLDCSGAVCRFRHYVAEGLKAGERVAVALRPQHLALAARDDGGVAEGVLEATVFLGDQSRHEVRLDDGKVVHVRAGDERPEPAAGDRVRVAVLPDHGVAVRDDEPAVPEPARDAVAA